ncbi:hypothetical protein P167DRAFT_531588 [Morchella conica CCBAS932]|uniref:RBR-type E3 ubiquitin transferase n=1 Tax=Morchella conica CCBAS932 TaxID=1392247 RepID=A0A3N4L465_9PEZI|nr:hypothetical protein P167DRAFT_531588 [Morchella conica CCBAS932]
MLEYTLRLSLVELQHSTAAAAAAIPTPTPTPTPAAPVRTTTPRPRPGPSQVREGREKNIFEKLDFPPRNPVRAHMADPGPARGTCAMCSSDTGVQSAPCGCTYCSGCIIRMFMYTTRRDPYQPLQCCRIEFPMELTDTAFAYLEAARNAAGAATSAAAPTRAQSNNTTAGLGKGKGKNRERERESAARRTFDCVACMDSFVLDDVMVAPDCNHNYCRPCMNRLFVESTKSEDLYPPSCCKQAIPITWANLVLNTEEQNQFYAKSEEWKTPNRLYCSRRPCSAFIPPLRVNADYGTCAKCLARTCAHCKGAFHRGEACPKDKATQDVLNLAQTAGWRKCFSCNMMVELGSGCNHITCR